MKRHETRSSRGIKGFTLSIFQNKYINTLQNIKKHTKTNYFVLESRKISNT